MRCILGECLKDQARTRRQLKPHRLPQPTEMFPLRSTPMTLRTEHQLPILLRTHPVGFASVNIPSALNDIQAACLRAMPQVQARLRSYPPGMYALPYQQPNRTVSLSLHPLQEEAASDIKRKP